MNSPRFDAPKVFVSYAWENRDHKQWVKELAVRLRMDGVELILDQWELRPGDQLPEFMENSVRTSDAVLIICTPSFKQKADQRTGGVGYEGSVITSEVLSGVIRRKFIPLLRIGEWKDAAPSWLLGSVYLDFRSDGRRIEDSYLELIETLHDQREEPPPVGSPPFPKKHRHELPSPNDLKRLDGVLSSTSYPFVAKTLLDTGRADPATHESVKSWLMLNSDKTSSSWPFVFNALVRANPEDDQLLDLGLSWLLQTSQDNSSWTHVWHTLMNARPDDQQLTQLGRGWLLRK